MKSFIKKTLLFVLPIILLFFFFEKKYRDVPNDYSLKISVMDRSVDSIQVLILGSSHGVMGVNPLFFDFKSLNMANVSQSLDIDLEILDKYIGKMSSLEYVLLPISYHSLASGSITEGSESWRANYYNIYYDMNVEHNVFNKSLILNGRVLDNVKRLIKFYGFNSNYIIVDSLGYITKKSIQDLEKIREEARTAVQRHTKRNNQKNWETNQAILVEFVQLCKRYNVKLIFFTPPFHSTYRQLLDQDQMNKTIAVVDSLVDDKLIYYFNLADSDSFLSMIDFSDSNHLSTSGAEKLTKQLNDILKSIQARDSH